MRKWLVVVTLIILLVPVVLSGQSTTAWPMMQAIMLGDVDSVKSVIEHGANVNARDIVGMTPLQAAASNGRTDIAALLIKHGADVNAKDREGRTPLQDAANADVAVLLIEHGAKVKKERKFYLSLEPLYLIISIKLTS